MYDGVKLREQVAAQRFGYFGCYFADDLGAEASHHPLIVRVEALCDYLLDGLVEELLVLGFERVSVLDYVSCPRQVLSYYMLGLHNITNKGSNSRISSLAHKVPRDLSIS